MRKWRGYWRRCASPALNPLEDGDQKWQTLLVEIGQFIVKTHGTCGGRARLSGKRIPVSSVYRWFQKGCAPEDILEKFDGVVLPEIYAAISYALANLPEIIAQIQEEDRIAAEAFASLKAESARSSE